MAFIIFFFLKKFQKVEKTGIISTKFSLRCTPSVILGFKQLLSGFVNISVIAFIFLSSLRLWIRMFKACGSVYLLLFQLWEKVHDFENERDNGITTQILTYLPYARHYNPRFVYFLPTFWSPKTFFQGAFFLKFWPYVWLVFKSGF